MTLPQGRNKSPGAPAAGKLTSARRPSQEPASARRLRERPRQTSRSLLPGRFIMIHSSCHCGAVRLEVDVAPHEVTDCNCSICRRYGVLWAYYTPRQVRVAGAETATYQWDDRSIRFHRCQHCGCVTHWSAVDPRLERMGVNARLMEPAVLAQARIRHLDGAGTERYID